MQTSTWSRANEAPQSSLATLLANHSSTKWIQSTYLWDLFENTSIAIVPALGFSVTASLSLYFLSMQRDHLAREYAMAKCSQKYIPRKKRAMFRDWIQANVQPRGSFE